MLEPIGSKRAFFGGLLVLLLLISLCSGALAQDITKPVITDITAGVPVTGGNFTITIQVTDDYAVSTVYAYPYFIIPGGSLTVTATLMTVMPNNLYEIMLNVPLNATELKYSIIAKDYSPNVAITDVNSLPVEDNLDPVAAVTPAVLLNMGDEYTFNGSASTDNVEIANYSWSLNYYGGTRKLNGLNPSFKFDVPGIYSGILVVRDPWGNTDSADFLVTVLDIESPVADAGILSIVFVGNVSFFDGTASTDNAAITNYTWAFTYNGTGVLLYGDSPIFVFWTPGVYEVTLTVADAAGNEDTAFMSVQVLKNSESEAGISWWVYALVIMIIAIMIAGIVIIRM
ncbi:MAG: PKD domain-containing protein [Candidatus Thermoplasmatota archaeon]|nr:hypothetical protein [Euryarchaeota archaeon]MBU4070863.1 PKD domain-containing protein [Candidatus Thermoplasmatota archaeon]MBU4145084.1 PKD domain-containing protein [Candidatus Thermoplasmatota archaeon]MBU4592065.1 PKD domain-containing protein [Candidatus Thermoplasmatota archaeon]